MVNEERFNIRIRPRVFAQLVLPVETAKRNHKFMKTLLADIQVNSKERT